ncbi:MAG: hypothetical protein RLZZ200_2595 [Pseudomonadota bacterium]|jgi:hypothetical protein
MSANLRLIWDNAVDRGTVTASHTSGSLVASNLKKDERAAMWRGTGTTETLLVEWTAAEIVDSVCLAWTNLTALATVQLKGYTLPADYPASPAFDVTFNPDDALPLGEFVWGIDPLAQSGASRARTAAQAQGWLAAPHALRKLEVIIADTTNSLGYVEASRLVAGVRSEMSHNPSYNAVRLAWIDRSKPVRAESGDLRLEVFTKYRQLQIQLDWMDVADRNAILRMVANGLGRGVWVSLMPEDADASNKQAYAFWGALMKDTEFNLPFFATYSAPLVFEEMG